jgi:asparagine synthase (glutamine-hydrolysing)
MAGVAGWVDFERDLRRDQGVVRAMTATLAARGPDAEGLWAAPHAVIGSRRLAVVDLHGGGQPMVAEEDGRPLAVLTYNGELYNAAALRHELSAAGHRFRTRSDTEVVLHSYLEWGERCPERLDGMFAFAVWDARQEALTLFRDRLGIKPMYYFPTPTGLLFGSEPKAILAHPQAAPVVDEDGLREVLAFAGTPGHGVFRGMHKMLPGHVLRFDRRGVTGRCYWRLEAAPHTDDLDATIQTVRGLVEDAVDRRLGADVPLCVLLSGGLDSSTVVALASRSLRHRGGTLKTFTVDFATAAERAALDPMRTALDAPYAAEVARHFGTDHEHIPLHTADLSDPVVRAGMLRAQQDLPTPVCEMSTSVYLLCRAVREHATVGLTGEWADDVFGSYLGIEDPKVVNAETLPWVAFAQEHTVRTGLGTGLFAPDLLKQLDIPGYCAQRYREALAEVPAVVAEPHEQRMRALTYLHLRGWFEIGVALNDGASMAAGMEWRSPYCDHRLVQYLFNTPWSMRRFEGRPKSLLRAAVKDLLPRSVLERRPSPFPVTHDPAYTRFLRDQLAEVLASPAAPVGPLLDADSVHDLLDGQEGLAWRDRTSAEMLLQTNLWLDQYRVRLTL